MQTMYRGRVVTRQNILDAFDVIDHRYPNLNDYNDWLARQSLMYVVRHKHRYYPPARVISIATDFGLAESSSGEQTTRLFVDLGFEVIIADNGGFQPPPSTFGALASRIKKWFGKAPDGLNEVGSGSVISSEPEQVYREAKSDPAKTVRTQRNQAKSVAAAKASSRAGIRSFQQDGVKQSSQEEESNVHATRPPLAANHTTESEPKPSDDTKTRSGRNISSGHALDSEVLQRGENPADRKEDTSFSGLSLPSTANTKNHSEPAYKTEPTHHKNSSVSTTRNSSRISAASKTLISSESDQAVTEVDTAQEHPVSSRGGQTLAQYRPTVPAIPHKSEAEMSHIVTPPPPEHNHTKQGEPSSDNTKPSMVGDDTSRSVTQLLLDARWHPRTWSELVELMSVNDRLFTSTIPIANLVALLRGVPFGQSVATAVVAQRCQTFSDLLDTPDFIWQARHYLTKSELNLLLITTTDCLRITLATRSSHQTKEYGLMALTSDTVNEELPVTDHSAIAPSQPKTVVHDSGLPSAVSDPHHTSQSPNRHLHDTSIPAAETESTPASTGKVIRVTEPKALHIETSVGVADDPESRALQAWAKVQDRAKDFRTAQLQAISFGEAAQNMSNVRARNILFRRMPRNRSLYYLLEMSGHKLLQLRGMGPTTLEALAIEVLDFLESVSARACAETKEDDRFASTQSDAKAETRHAIQAQISWSQVQNAAQKYSEKHLRSVSMRQISKFSSSKRAYNAVKHLISSRGTLYDLLQLDESRLLRIRNVGIGTLDVLARDVMDILVRISDAGLGELTDRTESTEFYAITPGTKSITDRLPYLSQPSQSETSWTTIQKLLMVHEAEQLKTVTLSNVASRILDRRAQNVVKQYFAPKYSFYDFLGLSEEVMLQVPHFGPKSLEVLAQEIIRILRQVPLEELNAEEPAPVPANATKSQPDWSRVCDINYRLVSRRQIEIIQRYHGYYGERETLDKIGQRFNLTRERIRQLKSKANRYMSTRFSRKIVAQALHAHARTVLLTAVEQISPIALLNAPNDPRVIPPDEQWILSWFTEIYGKDWYTQGLISWTGRTPTDLIQETLEGVVVPLSVVDYLKRYTYTPLRMEEALLIAQQADPTVTRSDLLVQLEEHPEIVLFTHGEVQIGHVSWRWFNSKNGREARRVEWALRLLHVPATPAEIARVLREQLGILDATPFSVAEAVENDAGRFLNDNGMYGLRLWRGTAQMVKPLTRLLTSGPTYFPRLAEQWLQQYNDPSKLEVVQATLYRNPDRFRIVKPLNWARADVVPSNNSFDPTSITFEDLLPTL